MTIDIQVAAEAAVEAADVAETLIQQFLTSGDWQVSEKPDNTPVTEVDVAVEKLIRERLTTALPVADFYGEETGRQSGNLSGTESGTQAGGPAGSRWLVDPIDGTKSFIRDLPYFSTQIALEVNGELVVGVSNAPSYGQRLVAVSGQGVTIMARRCRYADPSPRWSTLFCHPATWRHWLEIRRTGCGMARWSVGSNVFEAMGIFVITISCVRVRRI